MKKIVVFTGAGISAESGLSTFRDNGGLWDNYDINEVATPEAWTANPELVLDFYNMRRKNAFEAKPNKAHIELGLLEHFFDVHVITQNIDNLHERGGSTKVLHLHGEVDKVRSLGTGKVYDHGNQPLNFGDLCPDGFQLRPHIVWFGEPVPKLEIAAEIVSSADVFIVAGTSLNVYPAAGLAHCSPEKAIKFLVDPSDEVKIPSIKNLTVIKEKASTGIPKIIAELRELMIND